MSSLRVIDSLSYWLAAGLYAAGAIGYLLGLVLDRPRAGRWGRMAATFGLLANGANVVLHWARVGHGPFLGRVEVVSSTALVVIFAFLLASRLTPLIAPAGGAVLTIAFMAMGAVGVTSGAGTAELPLYYKSGWLAIHVIFTQLYVAFALMAAGLGFFYLRGRELKGRLRALVPSSADTDLYIYRFTLLAFIFLTVMILSGSIWANTAWGSYWSWDPIEVWSFITWLITAIELHMIITYNWHGRRLAWLSVGGLVVGLFACFGAVVVFPTIHSFYMIK